MHVILFDSNMQVIQANVTRQSSPIINEAPTAVKQPRKAIQVSSKVGKKVKYDAYQVKIIGTMKTGFGFNSMKVVACAGGYEFLPAQNIDYLHT